jgi:simple sugar transport system ATP-binding protein
MEIIRLENIWKSFGKIHALEGVNFSLKKNEIVGLLGDNGAGKSTLVKIISGVFPHDKGNFYLNGEKIEKFSPKLARQNRIETVHQDRSLAENQAIWRNFFMGRHKTNFLGFIDKKFEKKETLKILQKNLGLKGVGVTPDSPVSSLSGGERQGLSIGRAMYFDSEVIILDEPTTALAQNESQKVISFIKEIKNQGKSCILITHNLRHVFEVADRFVIVSRGKTDTIINKKDTDLDNLTKILIDHAGI